MRGNRTPLSTIPMAPSVITVSTGWELPVPISDQEPCPAADVSEVQDQVPRRLNHPHSCRAFGGAENPDSAAGVLDHCERLGTTRCGPSHWPRTCSGSRIPGYPEEQATAPCP